MKMFFIILSMLASMNTSCENIRCDTATMTANNYFTEEETVIACLTDSAGNDWIVYDMESPVGSKYVIQYDTKGTDDIYDDEIINAIRLDG